MFYAQRQALNRPLLQHVSACYTHNNRAGYCLALGERSLRALPFVRIKSYGLIIASSKLQNH